MKTLHGVGTRRVGGNSSDNWVDRSFLYIKKRPQALKTFLEILPCAVGLWGPDSVLYLLNDRASKLIGFSDREFTKDASLWLSRIHPRDRSLFSTARKKLLSGETMVACDYRFFPSSDEKNLWLRDVSVSYRNPSGEVQGIISSYHDITALKERRTKNQEAERRTEIVEGLVHEIQNYLNVIYTGLDLMVGSHGETPESKPVLKAAKQVNEYMQELREYFLPPQGQISKIHPRVILEEVLREFERELQRQGILLRVDRRSTLPSVSVDLEQFRNALERVMEFCRALLPQGGEIKIGSGLKSIGGRRYVELQMVSSSPTSLGVEEEDVFRPFLRVNGYQVGLGIVIADQIFRRHKGKILFQKENQNRGMFTLLLDAH